MRNILNGFMIGAAAMLMSGAAWAATLVTADVPFSFQFGGKTLPAGQYQIDDMRSPGIVKVVTVQNRETHQAVMSIGAPAGNPRATESNPRLVFQCGAAGCYLSQVLLTNSAFTYNVPESNGPHYTASIPLNTQKAD